MKKLITILLLLFTVSGFSQTPAFPCAEGFGKYSQGGRGGQVMYVTNLNDSGPGSFREACEASGPRIVLFQVGGRIEVTSTINISNPYITIDGSRAPGDGICIGADNNDRSFTTVRFTTNDIIIRHIRFRRNNQTTQSGQTSTNDDNLSVAQGAQNIMVDHCSFSQASDEAFSMYDYDGNGVADTKNITIQSCIVGRAYKGSSKGQIASGALDKITWYKNLWVSNFQRNVLLKNDQDYGAIADSYFEFVNNVIYDAKFKTSFSDRDTLSGLRHINYINNHYFENAGGSDQRRLLKMESPNPVKAYVRGNICPTRLTISTPVNWTEEWNVTMGSDDYVDWNNDGTATQGTPDLGQINSYPFADLSYQDIIPYNTPIITDNVNLLNATDIFNTIKNDVGASLPIRDNYDSARVTDVENLIQTYGAVADAIQVYNNGSFYTDSDLDGMEDSWEINTYGSLARDGKLDFDNDGYTDLEEFLYSNISCGVVTPNSCGNKNDPIATIASPTLTSFNKEDTVSFSVSYTSDTTISSVAYYLNGSLLSITTFPFTLDKNHLPQGIDTVYAEVEDVCGNISITPEIIFTVSPIEVSACKTLSVPVIDGVEDALWNLIPSQNLGVTKIGETATDTNDLKASFKITWDATSLYFFVKVKDDTLISDSPGLTKFHQDDAVCLFIDGLDEDNTTYDANDFYIGIRQGGIDISVNSTLHTGSGIVKSDVVTADGYNMEVKIDWSYIGITPTVGNNIGLDVRVDDDDNGGPQREHHVLWNDETSTPWKNPSKFGNLQLTNTDCQNTTSIKTQDEDALTIYPNPTNGELTITSNNLINKIEVYNSLGALVYSEESINAQTKELNLIKLPKGVYSVKVYEANKTVEKQIIKQ